MKIPNIDLIHPESLKAGMLIAINKPLQWTSFDVVSKIKVAAKYKWGIPKIKIGHAGTLDPLASGLLLICSGRMTREIDTYQAAIKTYEGAFMLGATRPSYDMETEINEVFSTAHITADMIREVSELLTGKLDQFPPVFSAVKKEGKRLYDYARQGIDVKLESRKVEVFEFDVDDAEFPLIHFKIICSKGTYIRSLAHDFGRMLGSGAYLYKLIRTGIGDYSLDNSWELDQFLEQVANVKGIVK
jgi:tRNA pseudouridine55 synthase